MAGQGRIDNHRRPQAAACQRRPVCWRSPPMSVAQLGWAWRAWRARWR